MATNKLALIRYKTIDGCLRNRYRKWTLDSLIEKVSDTLKMLSPRGGAYWNFDYRFRYFSEQSAHRHRGPVRVSQ